MDMDPEFVLPPAVFVMSARTGGGEWDMSRVSTFMHAVMPPLNDLSRYGPHIAERCQDRVTYRVDKGDKIIKKRSTETPHLTQFSGRHVQKLHVDNMAELLNFESQRRIALLHHLMHATYKSKCTNILLAKNIAFVANISY